MKGIGNRRGGVECLIAVRSNGNDIIEVAVDVSKPLKAGRLCSGRLGFLKARRLRFG